MKSFQSNKTEKIRSRKKYLHVSLLCHYESPNLEILKFIVQFKLYSVCKCNYCCTHKFYMVKCA